jgi:hypothetical protein
VKKDTFEFTDNCRKSNHELNTIRTVKFGDELLEYNSCQCGVNTDLMESH